MIQASSQSQTGSDETANSKSYTVQTGHYEISCLRLNPFVLIESTTMKTTIQSNETLDVWRVFLTKILSNRQNRIQS